MTDEKKSGVVRIDNKLSRKIKELLEKEDNKSYCSSVSSFVNVAVTEMLERIESQDNKIRWRLKHG
jgi:Arc/MetJ-type ribon-helix-helix transcriptional regulator